MEIMGNSDDSQLKDSSVNEPANGRESDVRGSDLEDVHVGESALKETSHEEKLSKPPLVTSLTPLDMEMKENSDGSEQKDSSVTDPVNETDVRGTDLDCAHVKESAPEGTSHVEKLSNPLFVTSLITLDDTYIKNAANNTNGDVLFVDTLGTCEANEKDSNPSDPIVVDLSEGSTRCNEDFQLQKYRKCSESSVSDLSSIKSDSDNEVEIEEIFRKGPHVNNRHEATAYGELSLKELPPIQDLKISVPEAECQKVGIVSSIVNELVVVQAFPKTPALNIGTILFMNSGKDTLGEVFDVFGQVKEPYYTVRFNSEEHARSRGIKEGVEVLCAPRTEYTSYVFVYEMLKMKGSDASWENNHEPPTHCLDYSDDEDERVARRRKQKSKEASRDEANETEDNDVEMIDDDGVCSGPKSSALEGVRGKRSRPMRPSSASYGLRSKALDSTLQNDNQREGPTTFNRSCLSAASPNTPANVPPLTSAPPLHPPGHPPLRNFNSTGLIECDRELEDARRVNPNMFCSLPLYGLRLPLNRPPPPLITNHHPSSGPRNSLLPTPEPPNQPRPALLPSPSINPWNDGATPGPLFPLTSPNCVSSNPFRLPPPGTNRGPPPYRFPSPVSPNPNFNPQNADHPIQRPLASHSPFSFSSFPSPSFSHTFGAPSSLSPSRAMCPPGSGAFGRSSSFPAPLPPHNRLPYPPGDMRSYMLRPSSLFPRPSRPNNQ